MKRHYLLLTIGLLMLASLCFAQVGKDNKKTDVPSQFTVIGRIVDKQGRPATNALINIAKVDDKGNHSVRFIQKEIDGKKFFQAVPGQTQTDSNGMFKVVIDRADFSNREKRRIGLTYVSQVLGVKDLILRNKDGAAIVLIIDDNLRIADFREVVGDIVMKPEQGPPPGVAAASGSSAKPLAAGDNMQKYSALPPFREQLNGRNEVRVRNPNGFSVVVGVRSGLQGKDFEVSANGTASIYIPDGPYDVYFVYANEPTALFQGDSFTLKGNGVEIQIVKVVGGNYGVALQLTVVTSTTAPSRVAVPASAARVAWVVSTEVVAHETTAAPRRSSNDP